MAGTVPDNEHIMVGKLDMHIPFFMECAAMKTANVQAYQPHVYVYPLYLGFPSHVGHHRALSRVFCAMQSVLISYLFYTFTDLQFGKILTIEKCIKAYR